jgi:hypothetical protein
MNLATRNTICTHLLRKIFKCNLLLPCFIYVALGVDLTSKDKKQYIYKQIKPEYGHTQRIANSSSGITCDSTLAQTA